MKLCVSMLSLSNWQDEEFFELLRESEIEELELVPTKIWPNWSGFTRQSANEVKNYLEHHGFTIPSAQSLAFGVSNAFVFGNHLENGAFGESAKASRANLLSHLGNVFEVCSTFGELKYVFGSPSLRKREGLLMSQADSLALDFFNQCGNLVKRTGGTVALEANATDYGCDWITTSTELCNFIEKLNHPNVKLHLDTGNMKMMNENLDVQFEKLGAKAAHFHLSSARLEPINQSHITELKGHLKRANFSPARVSLEQKSVPYPAFRQSLSAFVGLRG